ncbi:DMT family transporter [Sabulicella glaciei]|uniref:DMT family transporter n=1 Tax=Sabulicella glaciei TaxID=2984948 RepID=A0ABT3NQK2_9PROT|nr:DMT family transporter [Roseococcus sp. MDT2-1-1]
MKEAKPPWLPLAPFLFVLLWSGGFTAVKAALPYAEALTLQAVRYVCVVAILLPLWLVLRPPVPDRATLWHLVRMGLVVQFGYFAAMNLGQQFGMGPGAIALIIGLQPVVVALLAPAVAGDPPVGARGWAGLGLGLLGAAMVILSGSGLRAGGWLGLFFSVLALALMAAGALMERRGGRPCHLVTANLVMCGVALLATVPLAWGIEAMQVRWTWEFVAALAYLVLVNSLISLSLLFLMLRHGEAARASSVFFLVPPVAAAIAWVVLGAAMTPLAIGGTAVAAVGVALVVARR